MVHLIGAGGHAKVILELLEQQNDIIGGIVDANPKIRELLGYPVTGELPANFNEKFDSVIISIGHNQTRKKLSNKLNVRYATAIHSSSNISVRSKMGCGTVVMAGVSINSEVSIGEHAIINTNASVDHDSRIGDFVHISPNAAIAGDVNIGEGSTIGIGACVIQGVSIGKWAIIGAGSVVIEDVPDLAVVVGVPGKIIKFIEENAG